MEESPTPAEQHGLSAVAGISRPEIRSHNHTFPLRKHILKGKEVTFRITDAATDVVVTITGFLIPYV